eukprot:m.682287 g.682287  ORF g.682287 m.682287 type:complete len:74 (-) comp58603_c1_seq28:3133-3354(-)
MLWRSVRSASTLTRSGLAVYIHWPFCNRICSYCDFNKYLPTKANAIPHQRMAAAYAIALQYEVVPLTSHDASF